MKRAKEVRISLGMSQARVAELLGITQQAYANYERGAREADYDTLKKLSTIFGVSIDYLLENDINTSNSAEHYIKETPHIIAYIDFLGIKQLIKNNDTQYLTKLKTIYDEIIDAADKISTIASDELNNIGFSSDVKIKIFSDNILIAVEYDEKSKARALHHFVYMISSFQYSVLSKHNLLMRGGITAGNLCFTDIFLCGSGLASAYFLEDNIAIYPRIILDASLTDELSKHTSAFDDHLLLYDSDNECYLNYVQIAKNSLEDFNSQNQLIINNFTIEISSLKAEKSPKLKEIQKQRWCLNYHTNAKITSEKVVSFPVTYEKAADGGIENPQPVKEDFETN